MNEMETMIRELKEELSHYRTEEILGYVANKLIVIGDDGDSIAENSNLHKKTNLDSPHQQLLYLIGLLMSTDYTFPNGSGNSVPGPQSLLPFARDTEEDNTTAFENDMERILSKVKKITDLYVSNFFPNVGSPAEIEDSQREQIGVSMPVFLAYFNMSVLRFEEQTIQRIQDWMSPFDGKLESEIGVSSADLIRFYKFTEEAFQRSIDDAADSFKSAMQTVFNSWNEEKIELASGTKDIDELWDGLMNDASSTRASYNERVIEDIQNLMMVSFEHITREFGDAKAQAIVAFLGLTRQRRDFSYYTEANPAYFQPLFEVGGDKFFVVHPKFILEGIYASLINTLESMHNRKLIDFYTHRGTSTETVTEALFKKIFGRNVPMYRAVCEVPKSEEHDLLIQYKDTLLIIEIKSSKVKEPMRMPEKAYIRIRDNFFGKSGIGGAYHQALKLKKFITSSEEVTLYHDKVVPFTVRHRDFREIHTVVITAEQFGPLNINMSSLLESDKGEEYPWSCNLYDLENLIGMFLYLHRDPENFLEYLRQRIRYHNKFISFDELEITEAYLLGQFGDFEKFGRIGFMMGPKELVDKIYYEKHGIDYDYPGIDKLRHKMGRNSPCYCGSGEKYKKCCGVS